MISSRREQVRPLVWAAAALATGALLHIDRLPLWATAAATVCITWRMLIAAGFLGMPRKALRVILTLTLLIVVYTQFRTLNGLSAGTALLVVMGSIKLLETSSARDRGIVIGASLILLLAACLDRQGLLRTPLYLAHAWLCCTAFAVSSHDGRGLANREAMLLAARSLLFAVPLALLLFVFFPRVAGAFWALPREPDAMTGLGDSMSPGSISTLSESGEPAFRARFIGPTPPAEERYWRGPVLHDFDGYTWTRIPGRSYRQQKLEYLGPPYRYQITMEPHSNSWWFALDIVTEPPTRRVIFTYDYQLLSWQPVTQQTTYEAVSHTRTRSSDEMTPLARRYETALPAGRNARSLQLARVIRAQNADDAAYVSAVLDYLKTNGFEYTLTPPRLDYDSVDDFLFNTRQGFCGHFASAFVSLMRAAGVPSRVVTGYLGGEWNPVGGFFVVRQSDAHAWAEVWLAGRGWARVDPTAVVAPERLQRGVFDLIPSAGSTPERLMRSFPWLARMRQNWEAMNAWWDESVLRFDFDRQLAFLEDLGIEKPGWKHLAWALGGGLALWLAWIAWHVGRRSKPTAPDPLARAYARLCEKLARAGVPREAHQGPLAYADALAERRPNIADLARPLLEKYADLRYGTATDADAFVSAVGRLRLPKPSEPFPPEWRAMLERAVPLYARMPVDLRLRLEPVTRAFLARIDFVGCNRLEVTDEMRLTIATQACLLVVRSHGLAYDELRSVLVYPDEFVVTESEEDEAGVVTEGTRALSGQTFDTARIILSWSDVLQSGATEEAYNVVLHEFAHYLDHSLGGALTNAGLAPRRAAFQQWHAVLDREYEKLCDAVDRDEPTLIDPYGADDPAEFFAVATETFFEQPRELRQHHPQLYGELSAFYGLDPAGWS